jgi:hypothetical protein
MPATTHRQARPDDCSDTARNHYFEVFNRGEGVIKVVKKRLPTLIFRRLAKADRVVLESVPLDEQYVLIWIFDASLQLMRNISVHRRNYGVPRRMTVRTARLVPVERLRWQLQES